MAEDDATRFETVGLPQGALPQPDGSVLWRVWAPKASRVTLVISPGDGPREVEMTAAEYGYFEHREEGVADGLRYAYRLDGGPERPDPASRWQPDGVNRPSAVFLPHEFEWSDVNWSGVPLSDLVIYELHVGTFTPEGTFAAVVDRLDELKDLGITAIEIMPVSQFPGERNWGYDGVHPYAAQNTYGGPRELQKLVDAAHGHGLAVFLDVVYNHLGPEGNYLGEFGHYFTDRYHTPWGAAINYDGPHSDHVRRYAIENAAGWVRDFHFDGLRLDAVQTIFDLSAKHLLWELQEAVHREAECQGRMVHVIAETNQNDVRIVSDVERGGYGVDGCWTDDFHHALHALLTGEREGYYAEWGAPGQLAKAFEKVFVFDGVYSPFFRRRHGSPVGTLDRGKFVICLKNHDQTGNRAMGDRYTSLLGPEAMRLATALWAIHPGTLLTFQGDEYGETRPFPFFCSFEAPELQEAVRQGRRREFEELEFEWSDDVPDPPSPETFEAAKLSWSWPEGSPQAHQRKLVRDLLHVRRDWPALRDRKHTSATVVESRGGDGAGKLLLVERGPDAALQVWANPSDRELPVPGLAPGERRLLLSTQGTRYGGSRELDAPLESLQPHELVAFGPQEWGPLS